LYRKALAAYKTITPLGFDEYRRIMGKRAKFEGAVFWGCFYKDQLIAYATCVKLGNVVSLGSTKSDSDYLKLFPNNALFYEITRYYLVQEKVRYVTNGMRTLLHPTKINDFLIRMGFRKVYARLNIELSHRAKIISKMNISTWGKSIHLDTFIPQAWAKLVGFDSLVKISKS
jgi:hypothetical protein